MCLDSTREQQVKMLDVSNTVLFFANIIGALIAKLDIV